jgi:aminoglycoside phosphotransferase (APT) family kinase protein
VLIGQGRHADVFALGDDRVLRRYRTGQSSEAEAAVMRHVHEHGYPVPRVFDAAGPDMVMERITGRSLLEAMTREPHRLPTYARLLAELHRSLHAIDAPPGWERPLGPGDRVLHLDLQPANIVMGEAGPVVLDWGWAGAGPPAADTAHTWLEMATSEVPGGPVIRAVGGLGRRLLVRRFLREFERDELVAVLPQVVDYRLARRLLTPKERHAVATFSPGRRRPSR